jgi:hypothetical protein
MRLAAIYGPTIPAVLVLWTIGLLPVIGRADSSLSGFAAPLQLAADTTAPERPESAVLVPPEQQQHWAVSIGGLYTHREGETAGWAPNAEADYSVNDRLMLHAMAPLAFDRVNSGGTHFGLGDVEGGVRYRFIDDDPQSWQPAVAIYPLLDFPTGKFQENLGTGRTHAFLPLWLSKSLGNWIPYGGGGYWINPGPSNRNWILVAAGLIRVIDQQWSLTSEVFHATSNKTGIKEQTGFNVGARYNVTDNHHVVFTIGRGLQNANVTNEATAYFSYILTF